MMFPTYFLNKRVRII